MCVYQAVMRSSPIVVALATFAAYVLSGHQLDAQTAFTSLALFGTIAHPFHVLPKVYEENSPTPNPNLIQTNVVVHPHSCHTTTAALLLCLCVAVRGVPR